MLNEKKKKQKTAYSIYIKFYLYKVLKKAKIENRSVVARSWCQAGNKEVHGNETY